MSRAECVQRIQALHGQQSLSVSSIRRWFVKFSQGRQQIQDAPRPGRPVHHTAARINQVSNLLAAEPWRTVRELAGHVQLLTNTTHRLLKQDLHVKKKSAHWIPHLLTAGQKLWRVACARAALTQMSRRGPVDHVVTCDESWFYTWDPMNKQQNKAWLTRGQKRPQVLCIEQATPKVMLIMFFDRFGLVHREFVPNRVGVTGALYLGVVQRMVQAVRRRRPVIFRQGRWGLLQDNASAHRSRPVVQFLNRMNITWISHPGYSPDLSPPDYWLFAHLKKRIRGTLHANVQLLQNSIDQELAQIQPQEWSAAMDRYPVRLRCCIQAHGEYFERE